LIALSLNLSIKSAKRASTLKTAFGIENMSSMSGKKMRVAVSSIPHFFDLIEVQMSSVTFAMQAIEAFVNEEINGERSQGKRKKFRVDGKELDWGAQRIQETYSTAKKLDQVLPSLRDCKSPSTSSHWADFLELRKLRDATVHMIAKKVFPADPNIPDLVFQLFQYDARKAPHTALALIEFLAGDTRKKMCDDARAQLNA